MKPRLSTKTFAIDGTAVLILALLVRIVFYLVSSSQPMERQHAEDSQGYLDLAQNLNHGAGFGRNFQTNSDSPPVWLPELLRTPGYPWVIAKTTPEPNQDARPMVLVQQVMELMICMSVFVICYLSFGRVPGLIAGVFAAVDLQGVTLANMLLSEMTFTVIFVAAAFAATRLLKERGWVWGVITGLLIGASVMVRPTTLYLGAFVGLFLVVAAIWTGRWTYAVTAVILVGTAYAPVVAWMARNKSKAGVYELTNMTQAGALYQAAVTLGRVKGISINAAMKDVCDQAGVELWQTRFLAISKADQKRLADVSRPIIRAHPTALLKEYVVRTANLTVGPEKYMLQVLGMPPVSFGLVEKSSSSQPKPERNVLGMVLLGVQVLFTLAVYIGVLRTLVQCVKGRVFPAWVWASFWFAMYTMGISAAVCVGDPRYRWPVIPLLIIVGAASFIRWEPDSTSDIALGQEKVVATATI